VIGPAETVTVDYDTASVVPNVKVYGDDWTPTDNNVDVTITNVGTIKVNGQAK